MEINMKKIILIICGIVLMNGNIAMAENNGIDKSTKTKKIKLGVHEVDIQRIRSSKKWLEIKNKKTKEVLNGEKYNKSERVTVFETPNSGYVGKDEDISFYSDWGETAKRDTKFTLYTTESEKIIEKEFKNANIAKGYVLRNGWFMLDIEKMDDNDHYNTKSRWEIYDKKGNLVYELQNVSQFMVSPQADYILILQKGENDKTTLKKLDLNGNLKTLINFNENKWFGNISEDGKYFVIVGGKDSKRMFQEGWYYRTKDIHFFKVDKLIWTKSLEAEAFYGAYLSKFGKYIIVRYERDVLWEKRKLSDSDETYWVHKKGTEYNKVLNTLSQEMIYDGLKDDTLINQYKKETINTKGNKGVK
jgi:hypothetical protein